MLRSSVKSPLSIGILVVAAMLLTSGCVFHQVPLTTWNSPLPADFHLYPPVITTGDLLEIRFYLNEQLQSESYRLGVGDILRMDFDMHPELGRESMMVLPDGTVALPLIGAVPVAGQTVARSSQAIAEKYAAIAFKDPIVVLSVMQGQQRLKHFLQSKSQQSDSENLVIPIYEGVPIQLPFIEAVAVDRPLNEMRDEIIEKYASEFGTQLNIVANLRQRETPTATVMGEVKLPGRIPLRHPLTPMGAIAAVGGYTDAADPKRVAVVRFTPDGSYQRWIFDLSAALNEEDAPHNAFKLSYDDVVIVVKTDIADVNVWVEQYLRKNIPISIGAGLPIGN